MDQVNDWPHSWCHVQGFRFYDLRHAFERPGMLTQDGAHLMKWGKSILGSKLSGLISRALNWIQQEKGMYLQVTQKNH